MTPRAAIYQIHYDEASRQCLEAGFMPLDNAASPDPSWYEFWPILQYLNTHTLQDDVWYGFVSPRFRRKARCSPTELFAFLQSVPDQTEVALFSPGWDQLCYFRHPWEQGEMWHPGITEAMQAFVDHLGHATQIADLVTDVTSSVFSNYVVAKKRYWLAWHALAQKLLDFMATHPHWQSRQVPYGNTANAKPIKAFLQERLASYLLATQPFQTAACRQAHQVRVFERLFPAGEAERRLLSLCDHFKRQYRQTAQQAFLSAYLDTRRLITLRDPYS